MKKVTIITLIFIMGVFGSQAIASINPGSISSMIADYQEFSKIQPIELPDDPLNEIPGDKHPVFNINSGGTSNPDDINWLNNNRSGGFNNDYRIGEDYDDSNDPDEYPPETTPPSIPEPITLILVGLGLTGIGVTRKLK